MTKKLFAEISARLHAMDNCQKSDNKEWLVKHQTFIDTIINEFAPSGSGFDNGTKLDETSKPEKLVFTTLFHHMNDNGYYDGWTNHTVIVTPSLCFGYNMRVTGKDKRQIKEYIADTFHAFLSQEFDVNAFYEKHKERLDA